MSLVSVSCRVRRYRCVSFTHFTQSAHAAAAAVVGSSGASDWQTRAQEEGDRVSRCVTERPGRQREIERPRESRVPLPRRQSFPRTRNSSSSPAARLRGSCLSVTQSPEGLPRFYYLCRWHVCHKGILVPVLLILTRSLLYLTSLLPSSCASLDSWAKTA